MDYKPFSEEKLKLEAKKDILQHNLVLFPTAIGIISIVAGIAFSIPTAIVVGVLSTITGIATYKLKNTRIGNLVKGKILLLRNEQKTKIKESKRSLQVKLLELDAPQASQQIDMLDKKVNTLTNIINEKIPQDNIENTRLHMLAENLYLATLENLTQVRQILETAKTIDIKYIKRQLKKAHNEEEKETLEERLQTHQDTLNDAESIIAKNEVAMTKINDLAIKIAKSNLTGNSMENSLHEITNNVREEQWVTQPQTQLYE